MEKEENTRYRFQTSRKPIFEPRPAVRSRFNYHFSSSPISSPPPSPTIVFFPFFPVTSFFFSTVGIKDIGFLPYSSSKTSRLEKIVWKKNWISINRDSFIWIFNKITWYGIFIWINCIKCLLLNLKFIFILYKNLISFSHSITSCINFICNKFFIYSLYINFL